MISKSFAFVSCYVLRCYTSSPRRNYNFETSCIRLISPYLHLWFWPFVLREIGRGRQDMSLSHLNFATGLTSDSKISTTYGKSVAIGSHLFFLPLGIVVIASHVLYLCAFWRTLCCKSCEPFLRAKHISLLPENHAAWPGLLGPLMPGNCVAESNRGTAVSAVPYAAWLLITPSSVTVNWIELLLWCVACSSAVVSARCRCYASIGKFVASRSAIAPRSWMRFAYVVGCYRGFLPAVSLGHRGHRC